jgi:signal peptidase I
VEREPTVLMNDNEQDPAPEPTESKPERAAGFDAGLGRVRPSSSPADDIVLRAFEEHARADLPPMQPSPSSPLSAGDEEAFEPLLGRYGAELVDEVSTAPIPRVATPQAWNQNSAVPPASLPPAIAAAQLEPAGVFPGGAPALDNTGFPPGEPTEAWAGTVVHEHNDRAKTLVREIVETGLLALLVFLAVRASFQNFKVDGSSMYPTLENGEFLIVNKLVYAEVNVDKLSNFIPFLDAGDTPKRYVFHGPERGDIIVLKDPRKPDTDLIKRVIGLPGETLQIVNGQVYINGYLLEEPYIKTAWHAEYAKITIPAGEYFVMGDNRDNSLDSRSASVGLVPKDFVIGKAMLSYWPSSKFGLAPNEEPTVTDKPLAAANTAGSVPTVKSGN